MLLLIADRNSSFPLVMVGGVLENNTKWDIGKEVINCITKDYPGACPIRPKVNILQLFLFFLVLEIMLIGNMLGVLDVRLQDLCYFVCCSSILKY